MQNMKNRVEKPDISVIVPVYKTEAYLESAIRSILCQTFSNFELILVDDGSPDRCGEMCDAFAEADSRIRVIHQENRGLSAARNVALAIAVGRYVTFIDSDDYIAAEYLGILFRMVRSYHAKVSACDKKYLKDTEEFVPDLDRGATEICLSGKKAVISLYSNEKNTIPMSMWGKLFKRELFDQIKFPVNKIHEDQAVLPILLYGAGKVVWRNEPIYGYRQTPDSITRQRFSLKRYDDIEAVTNCIAFFSKKGEDKIVRAAEKKKTELIAYYSLLARKNGLFKELPREYRMSRVRAVLYLRKNLPYYVYENRLFPICPLLIRCEAYSRKKLSDLKNHLPVM